MKAEVGSLWVASGEAPAQERFANVHYRRAFLVVNGAEAQQVRNIFELYLKNGSVIEVLRRLSQNGWTTKQWTTRSGNLHSGHAFNKNTLRALLSNVIYTGQVRCNGQLYPGEQEAIVDRGLWNDVNHRLFATLERVPSIEKL